MGNYFDQFDAPIEAGIVPLSSDGRGNFFDQFDTAPTAELWPPPGVTEAGRWGRRFVIPSAFIGTQSPLGTAPTTSTLAGGIAPLSQPGGNYFDRFDPPAKAPSLPDWMTNPAPSIWGDAMQLLGLGGQQDVSLAPSVPIAADNSGSAIGELSSGRNGFAQFDNPLWSDSPPQHFPYGLPLGSNAIDSTPASTAPSTSGANAPANSGSENAVFPQGAADALGTGAASEPPPSAQISRTPPKLLYSQLILGIKNASGGDYGKTRQWFADNGYGDLLLSNSPSQPSMFDRYWTMLGQHDEAKQEADAARKVGFGEAFAREGLRGLAGITELENRLLLPLYWGIDASSKAIAGYDPRLSAIPDFEAEQRNSLAIQPYEEPTFLGKIGEAAGQALPMVATAPLADAAIPAEGLSTLPEIAPTLWNATKAIAAKIPRGIGSMTPAAALASQDAADQGGTLEDQVKAASLAMATGAIPMLAESGASRLPLRIAERGAKSAALAIPINAGINNLLNPDRKTTAGFTADDIASAIPQVIAGALTGGREAPFHLSAETSSSGGNLIRGVDRASAASDQFLDRMRAALDADASARKGQSGGEAGTGNSGVLAAPVEISLACLSKDFTVAKRQIRDFISKLFQGRTFTIHSTGTDVRITAESRGESVSKARRVEQVAPMRSADRLIENAHFVESRAPVAGKPKAEASRAYTTFAVPLVLGGHLHASHFTIRGPKSYPPNSGIFYEFNLGPKIEGADVAMGLDRSSPASVAPRPTIRQLIDAVKQPRTPWRLARGGDASVLAQAKQDFLDMPFRVQTRDGRMIVLKHNKQGTVDTLWTHLATKYSQRTGGDFVNPVLSAWIPRIPQTLAEARVKFLDTRKGRSSTVYAAKYPGGHVHFVVVKPDGSLAGHEAPDYLWTHIRNSIGDIGEYGDMPAITFSKAGKDRPMSPSEGRGGTENAANISGQSDCGSGSTVLP